MPRVRLPRKQHGVDDGFRDLLSEKFSGIVIGSEVLPCVDAAESRFFRCRGEGREMTSYSRQRLGGHVKCESIAEGCAHNLRPRKADGAVSTGVGGIGRGFVRQRKPVWIRLCPGVIVLAGETNGRDGAPEIVRIFRFEEADRCVREADIQQRE